MSDINCAIKNLKLLTSWCVRRRRKSQIVAFAFCHLPWQLFNHVQNGHIVILVTRYSHVLRFLYEVTWLILQHNSTFAYKRCCSTFESTITSAKLATKEVLRGQVLWSFSKRWELILKELSILCCSQRSIVIQMNLHVFVFSIVNEIFIVPRVMKLGKTGSRKLSYSTKT